MEWRWHGKQHDARRCVESRLGETVIGSLVPGAGLGRICALSCACLLSKPVAPLAGIRRISVDKGVGSYRAFTRNPAAGDQNGLPDVSVRNHSVGAVLTAHRDLPAWRSRLYQVQDVARTPRAETPTPQTACDDSTIRLRSKIAQRGLDRTNPLNHQNLGTCHLCSFARLNDPHTPASIDLYPGSASHCAHGPHSGCAVLQAQKRRPRRSHASWENTIRRPGGPVRPGQWAHLRFDTALRTWPVCAGLSIHHSQPCTEELGHELSKSRPKWPSGFPSLPGHHDVRRPDG